MSASGWLQIVAFALSSLIAIAGALGMATTMSMFRSAIFLMASFLGVAALFILLAADLLGLLQVMMYIGGMIVMALFMVLFMPDPGGAMMAQMPGLKGPERWFSLELAPLRSGGAASHRHEHGPTHQRAHESPDKDEHATRRGHANGDPDTHDEESQVNGGEEIHHMNMKDMSMVTPVRAAAAWLAAAIGCGLITLLALRPHWSVSAATPDPRSAEQVGLLLMDKYMVGFEAAGFLILIGIVGAVLTAHPDRHPDRRDREARVAVDSPPSPIEPDGLPPLRSPREPPP